MPARARTAAQRGWAALIALLIALAIVAMLAGGMLRQYGLGEAPRANKPSRPTTAEQIGGVAPDVPEPAAVAPRDAINRARNVEGMVQQHAIDLDKRIDEQTTR
jgi:hypothetical protein